MKPSRFLHRVYAGIEEHGLIERGERVVVGVSGGPDSMTLLHCLVDVNRVHDLGWRLHVAHLNHGLRGEDADADAAFVEQQARALDLPVTVDHVDVKSSATTQKRSVEEEARFSRYAFFERLCLKTDSTCVALGHHADDNAETILHRVLRGTGIRGLVGIRRTRPFRPGSDIRLVRPLLEFRRDEIRRFVADMEIPYRTDSTNAQSEYTRNFIRNTLMPQVRDTINVRVADALLRLGQQADWMEGYLQETAERSLQSLIIHQDERELVINIPGVLRKGRIIQAELIRQAMLRFDIGEQDVGFGHLLALVRLCRQPDSGKIVHLPGGLVARRQYDRLILSGQDETAEPALRAVALTVPGKTPIPDTGMTVEAELCDFSYDQLDELTVAKSRYEEWMDYDCLAMPLMARSRRKGDRFRPLGSSGSKRLSEFFIDEKVEPGRRNRVPIVCDLHRPVWVVGMRLDDRVRLTPQTTRALHLRVVSVP